ncbi:LysR family transcriptional regulator [Terriglobus sp. TAA 43]|uniref:LysR family transcriptional regulator n=1 Tax=Terriglobus sp. TAA 43 TaxID=278961 RepID=UPI0009FC35E5|nr:LysR family transcriptional regulator [Terriglobus sp. TAA 43]
MRDELQALAAFAAVAEERSFTRAAARLRISQSALSHSVRGLEKRLGVQLLARTTRSVAPTAAGEAVLREVQPALERIARSLTEAQQQRDRPAGRLRLLVSRSAAQVVLMPKLKEFTEAYPDIALDITTSNDRAELVAGGYDAGIQIGEFIQRDMIAVRVSDDLRLAVVGSPSYFATHPKPRTPRDLKDHICLAFRFSTGIYRWEFEKGRRSITFLPEGPLVFDDSDLLMQCVERGAGISMAMETLARERLADGRLVEVMRDWCPVFPGYFLYYPSRHNQPAALTALIRTLRMPSQVSA